MKFILIVICIVALSAAFVACTRKTPSDTTGLDYNAMLLLDAEDLGEGSIGSAYNRDILPVMQQYVASPAEVVEELDADAGVYRVSSQGQTYLIYSSDTPEGESWGNATVALFDIVNRQLENSPVTFYAVNGGNDLGGMFLTEEEHEQALKAPDRKEDWPYLPQPKPPWYGQPHED